MAHILVADDEPEQRKLIVRLLNGAGHEVSTAANGAEALASLGQQAYDLLITDIYMPVMDGTELIAECRQTHPQLPIVAISGGSTFGEAYSIAALDAADSMGVAGSLLKPFLSEQLLTIIHKCLGTVPA
jgi:CheY-like chemotaxis protein